MINKFLMSNSKLARGITAKILCRSMSSTKAGPNTNRSIIFGLSASLEGILTLKALIDANPDIAKEMDAKALCLPMTRASNDEENQSALFWLCGHPRGQTLLIEFLNGNKVFASQINGAALCRRLPPIAAANVNSSALYFLCGGGINGRSILARLLDDNPKLAGQITGEDLCQPAVCEGNENKTALYWLSSLPEGLAILEQLLIRNPGLARGISAELLCQQLPKADGWNPNESILYWLCPLKKGRDNLRRMLNDNPELAGKITGEVLCRQLNNDHPTALYWLTSSDGIDILEKLLDHNPLLAKQITPQALCQPRSKEAGIFVNVSALYYLSESAAGIAILKRLLDKNPDLAAQIDHAALMRPVKFDESPIEDSVHFLLSRSEEGRSVLQLLVKTNKCIASPVVSRLEVPPASTSGLTEHSIFAKTDSGSLSQVNDNNVVKETQLSDCGPDKRG